MSNEERLNRLETTLETLVNGLTSVLSHAREDMLGEDDQVTVSRADLDEFTEGFDECPDGGSYRRELVDAWKRLRRAVEGK